MSDDRMYDKTTWVSNDHKKPDRMIFCQGCKGVIIFNSKEILDRKTIGTNTSTPCRFCGWHPSYPPEPWLEIPDAPEITSRYETYIERNTNTQERST